MSLAARKKLADVAKQVSRDLRKNSTRAERLLWERIRDRRFLGLKFYRQHPLFIDIGGHETFFVADFYCHEQRLVIELDGKIHAYRRRRDAARTEVINDLGMSVVRFTNENIEDDIAGVLTTLRNMID